MVRILIIDDEEPIRANLVRFLALEGFEVTAAGDGSVGIDLARSFAPDLVLCDIVMPEIDGYAVLSALREDPLLRSVPFVFLTASADPAEREQCLQRGAQAYVSKPFNLRQVLEVIRRCLGSSAAST